MSILINMEMPKNCLECTFYRQTDPIYDYCCISSAVPKSYVPKDCPLIEVPPHGDLIDRDWLTRDECQHYDYIADEWYVQMRMVENAPTIIPADKEGA